MTPSDMGKLSHKKARERMGDEKYREMQLKKSLQAKVARDFKKKTGDNSFDKENKQVKI